MQPKALATLAGLVTALMIGLALSPADTSAHLKFNPTLAVCAEDVDTAGVRCDGDVSAGSQADISLDFSLGLGPDGDPGTEDDTNDANFIALVNFFNPAFTVPDAQAQIGALVGQVISTPTLGLQNQPCATQLPITFDMIAASVDPADTTPDQPAAPDPDWPGFADANGNSLQDAVDKYPAFLNTLFPGLTPLSRSISFQSVGQPIIVQQLTFPAGSDFPVLAPNHPPFDESLGLPIVTVLQDPTAPPDPTSPITDFCTPLQSSIVSFKVSKDNRDTADVDEGGITLLANPEGGPYAFTSWTRSARDADDDGWEQGDVTGVDTCPLQANHGNPRLKGDGDADEDGLDAACDPNDNDQNSDQDGDVFSNRQDSCPLVANPDQKDSDQDGIGDACDIAGAEITLPDGSVGSLQGPDTPDGESVELFVEGELVISGGGGGGFPLWAAIVAGVGGGALLLAVAGAAFTSRRRR